MASKANMKETIEAMDFRATTDKFEHDPVVYGDNAVWISG